MYLYFYQKPDKFLLQINIFIPALGYILILHAISDISFLVPDDLSDPTCRICTACHDISNNIWKKDVSLRHELYTLSFPYPLFVYCYCYAKCYYIYGIARDIEVGICPLSELCLCKTHHNKEILLMKWHMH